MIHLRALSQKIEIYRKHNEEKKFTRKKCQSWSFIDYWQCTAHTHNALQQLQWFRKIFQGIFQLSNLHSKTQYRVTNHYEIILLAVNKNHQNTQNRIDYSIWSPMYLPIRGKDDLIRVAMRKKKDYVTSLSFSLSFAWVQIGASVCVCVWGKELTIHKIMLMSEVQSSKSTKRLNLVLKSVSWEWQVVHPVSDFLLQRHKKAEEISDRVETENEKKNKTRLKLSSEGGISETGHDQPVLLQCVTSQNLTQHIWNAIEKRGRG